jgi:hypothetical protein
MLSDNPSKAEELACWQAFLSTLPRCSYLAMYLEGSTEILHRAMANDESTELVAQLRRGRAEAREDEAQAIQARKEALEQLATVKQQIARGNRELCSIRDDLRRASESARTLVRCADEAYQRAVNAVLKRLV